MLNFTTGDEDNGYQNSDVLTTMNLVLDGLERSAQTDLEKDLVLTLKDFNSLLVEYIQEFARLSVVLDPDFEIGADPNKLVTYTLEKLEELASLEELFKKKYSKSKFFKFKKNSKSEL